MRFILRIWPIVALVFSGCASGYYVGIHHLENNGRSTYIQSVASSKDDKELANYEKKALDSLLSGNIAAANIYLSDSLLSNLGPVGIDSLDQFLASSDFNRYRKIGLSGGGGFDEALFKRPFDYYDMMQGRYLLAGDSLSAILTLWFEKVEGDLKVCGIAVVECRTISAKDCRYETGAFEFAARFSRSVDRAGLTRRVYSSIPAK